MKQGLQRQLESQVATGSLENEAGLKNKVNLGSEVWYVRVHNKRPKVVLESVVGLKSEVRVHKRRRRWSWRL